MKFNVKKINGFVIFLLFSTMFIYWSLGLVWLLALFSIGLLFNLSESKKLLEQPFFIHHLPILLLTMFGLLMMNMLLRDGFDIDRFGLALGIFFSTFIYYNIYSYGVSSNWVRYGLIIAGIVGGSAGLYQYFQLNVTRPGTLYSAMVFGVLGSLMIVVLGIKLLSTFKAGSWLQNILLLAAFLLSFCILLVSQSRSGYLFLASFVVFAFVYTRAWQYRMVNFSLVAALLISMSALYIAKDTSLVKRFNQGIDITIDYLQGNTSVKSSETVRMEMWMAGYEAFKLNPVFGMGNVQIVEKMKQIRDENKYHRRVTGEGHLHSDYFDSLARYGLVGFICYFMLYSIALRVIHKTQALSLPEKLSAFAFVLSFLVFGLTTTNYSYVLTQIFIFVGIPMLVAWIYHKQYTEQN